MDWFRWAGVAVALTFAPTAAAAPRQRIEWPWDRWAQFAVPTQVTLDLANGAIKSIKAGTSAAYTSPDPAGKWAASTDGAWLLAKVKAYYSCKGTQVHKKVGLSSNWDSRSFSAAGKTQRRTYLDMKLAKANDLQMLCNSKGTWHGRDVGEMRVVSKQFTANYNVQLSATCKAPLAPTRYPKTTEQYTVIGVCDTAMFDTLKLRELRLYWNGSLRDNLTMNAAPAAGYTQVRGEGWVYKAGGVGLVPLRLFYSAARHDYFTTATPQGMAAAKAAGYVEKKVVGYVYPTQLKGTKPLKLFWSGPRQDNITVSSVQGQQDAMAAGYTFVRNEGYVIY